jgi:hypothetical protein
MESGRGRRKKEGEKERGREKAVACLSGNGGVRSIRRERGGDKKPSTQRVPPKYPAKERSQRRRVKKAGLN